MRTVLFLCLGLANLLPPVIQTAHGQLTQVLSIDSFIDRVKKFHPVAQQAGLVPRIAQAEMQMARGAFDPVIHWDNNRKTFDGMQYYHYSQPELTLPTSLGIDLKTGVESSLGSYKNPELTSGVASHIGAELSVLKNLVIDKRRAALRQAKIYSQQSEQQKALMINDLIYEAHNAYWQWAAAYKQFWIYDRYVEVAMDRLKLVQLTFRQGDRSLADTVEAYTQLQNYQLLKAEALLALSNRMVDLSQFLWDANQNPFSIPEQQLPDTSALTRLDVLPPFESMLRQQDDQHPLLNIYQFKLEALSVERTLKFQQLLPDLRLRGNILSKEYYRYKGLDAVYFDNNYKFGFSFNMPLLLRQARGEYKKVRLAIQDLDFQRRQKNWELQNKLRQYFNEAKNLRDQLMVARSINANYAFLLKTEQLKFAQGESSIFLINSRETKLLESEQKIVDLQFKYRKAVNALYWAAGVLR